VDTVKKSASLGHVNALIKYLYSFVKSLIISRYLHDICLQVPAEAAVFVRNWIAQKDQAFAPEKGLPKLHDLVVFKVWRHTNCNLL
jgi:hypothetical protein